VGHPKDVGVIEAADPRGYIMKRRSMSLEDRLAIAAQACRAAHLLSCETTCWDAIAELQRLRLIEDERDALLLRRTKGY
jgi:hypothetical protein